MKHYRAGMIGILLAILLAGCASVKTEREWERVIETALKNTGETLVWEQTEKDRDAIRDAVNRLLEEGLTREEAVRIALMNNRELQSLFEEIGIAKSDLVQAGLFSNPSLGVLFRFPFGGGTTNIEASGFLSVSDLWQVPFRKRVAGAHMEAVMMRVGEAVLRTAMQAKNAYDDVLYLTLVKKETEEVYGKIIEIGDEMKRRRDFGFMSDLDVYLSEAMLAEAEVEKSGIHSELGIAKVHLERILGLKPFESDYEIKDIPEKLPAIPEKERAFEHALKNRLDVQMTRFKILEAERMLRLEKVRFLKNVETGVSYEKDTDGSEVLGPGVDIQVPLFDQNQAQIARAKYMLRAAKKNLQALEGEVAEQIASDLERIGFYEKRMDIFQKKILPSYEHAMKYTEKYVGSMQLNKLRLLETQKGLLSKRLDYLKARREAKKALVDLEYHLGGKLPR